jgi:hypothetical protein
MSLDEQDAADVAEMEVTGENGPFVVIVTYPPDFSTKAWGSFASAPEAIEWGEDHCGTLNRMYSAVHIATAASYALYALRDPEGL